MEEKSRERIEYALRELERSINSINLLRSRLVESFNEKFPDYRDDTPDVLSSVEMLLLTLHSKINSISRFYEMVIILEESAKMMNMVIDEISILLPSIEQSLYNIMNSLIEVKAVLGIKDEKIVPELPYIDE